MKKKVFICHRPYHILRSCDIVRRDNDKDVINVLIDFDVKIAGKEEYQRFDSNKIFYSVFDEVINIGRNQPPSITKIHSFRNYCKVKRKEYLPIVKMHSDADVLYFYCDNEVEIQLLLGMFVDKAQTVQKRIMVDEGLASYVTWRRHASLKTQLFIRVLCKTIGIRNFNWKWAYGKSTFYNQSLANSPEHACFAPPIEKLPPISDETCSLLKEKISSPVGANGEVYFLYITTTATPFEKEKEVLEHIKPILDKYNVHLFIKLHPQQDESKYGKMFEGLDFIDKSYPVELFFSSKAIIAGVGSSSLYNASLQGYYSMDISPLFGKTEIGIGSDFEWIKIPVAESYESFEKQIKKRTF